MKICHITHGRVNPDGDNGVTRTVYNLNSYLNKNDFKSVIYSFDDRQKIVEEFTRDENTKIKLFPRASIFNRNQMADFISSDDFDFDVVHIHLMWFRDKLPVLKQLNKKKVPYIITAHGAYAPNLVNSLKKKLSLLTEEGRYIRDASKIHALCNEEKFYLRQYGFKNHIKVIPNGIGSLEKLAVSKAKAECSPYTNGKLNLSWIGRIRPDKNVYGLIEAISRLDDKTLSLIHLNIIGDGDKNYVSELKKYLELNGLSQFVTFHGGKYGHEKYLYLYHSDLYVQPSFSEGISFAILDAMACQLPMILSRQTNMTYYFNRNFYVMTEPFADDLASNIRSLISNPQKMASLKNTLVNVVDELFSWDELVFDYASMYKEAADHAK